ncbi:MAG: YceI family protein [Bacteroidetes bacterium]|nr:YceI family protein [Bacteroidota bacterium]
MILSSLFSMWLSILLTATPLQPTVYTLSSQSNLAVKGTSTLHDWIMEMESLEGKATFNLDEESNLTVSDLTLTLKTEELKSEHDKMDKIAYEALKSDKYPKITFKASELKTLSKNGNVIKVSGKGQLTIAGVTKTITLNADCKVTDNGQITCTGSKKIKMSDYGIDPPTAMFGTIKTGDDLTIVFSAGFAQIGQ